jgi:hypothetical protein
VSELDLWEFVFACAIFLFLAWIIGGRVALVLSLISKDSLIHHVTAPLEQATRQMVTQLPAQEAEKVAHQLEALGHRVDRDTYRQVLEAVERDVAARLQSAKL